MADRRAERSEEDADKFSSLDPHDDTGYKLDFKLDHCDLLLDAIDAQLDQLQVQSTKHEAISRQVDCDDAAPLRWSHSLSKDTGFGSSTQTNDTPMSCLELMHTPTIEQISENAPHCWEGPVNPQETEEKRARQPKDKEDSECRREQVIWRLERLLGETCSDGGMVGETPAPSDSICTEDFVRCFREEMVEVAVPGGSSQQLDTEKEAEGAKLCDSHSKEEQHSIADVVRERFQTKTSHRAAVVTNRENVQHNNNSSCPPKARCLAGVPVLSFDAVSIDSDLDTVRTDEVRQHLQERSGWQSLIQSVTHVNDASTTKSDCDTLTQQDDSEPQSDSDQRSTNKQNKGICIRKAAKHSKRGALSRVCLSDKDTDEEMSSWTGRSRTERTSQSEWTKTKARLANLKQKCEKEEATLRLKRIQLRDADLRLSDLQWKKKHALQDFERLTADRAQMEEEKRVLESVLRDSRMEKDSICCELQMLQRQKDSTEADLAVLSQRKQTLNDAPSMNKSRVHVSVLEREEMERQLDGAKTELFSEQRRAREQLESMQEKLEETCEELQRAAEAEESLKTSCNLLEEAQKRKKQHMKALEVQVCKLQDELGDSKMRVGALEKMLAQKELQLLKAQERCGALQTESDGQKGALQHLEAQHYRSLKEAQEQAQEKRLKEEEINLLRKSVQQQKDEAKKREDQLNADALKKLHKAVEAERMKWDLKKVEAVQQLEEQNRRSLESLRSELQRERSKAQALQHEVWELQKKSQELETESCAQQREQESLLAVICKSLKEEHQAELQRLQTHVAQSQMKALRLQQDAQLVTTERDELRGTLEGKERSLDQSRAEMEQRLAGWVQQLAAECQHLHRLVQHTGATQRAASPPSSLTVAEALDNLKTVRGQLKCFISRLHKELESQKQSNEQLRTDKERELSIQRQQLRAERDQALNSIKERLIQEHIEELSSLKCAHARDGAADGCGATASLRRQLRAKDVELRQVQKSMAAWKEQTANRLACKFEEELTAELERCRTKLLRERKSSQTGEERQRVSESPAVEMTGAKGAQAPRRSPSLHAVDFAASYSLPDAASFKLLRYLQSRVKQLRVENQSFMWRHNASEKTTTPSYLSGSYLTTVTQGQYSTGILSQSSIRTLSSEGHQTSHCVSN